MSKNILVVDDSMFMRMMIKDMLKQGGYTVIGEASNGIECVKKYQELHPDLITLDITMDEMDGITALKEIMKINKHAKVIMCTAMGQQILVVEAIQSGAKDFLVKPFDASRVITAVQKLIG